MGGRYPTVTVPPGYIPTTGGNGLYGPWRDENGRKQKYLLGAFREIVDRFSFQDLQ